MTIRGFLKTLMLAATVTLVPSVPSAGEIRVAAASNFADAMRALAASFEGQTGHHVTLSFGSTGKHYAQIRNGAPFDVFFAADAERPRLLEQEGVARRGTRFTYAYGRLVLWSPDKELVDPDGRVLERGNFRYLAIANPKLAPYGRAAREVLQARGLWDGLGGRIARGENVAQAFQFVNSGNADLGFVARSQIERLGPRVEGSCWDVPAALHRPIEQQAVLLRATDAARDFLTFVRSGHGFGIIRAHGYDTP
jgi:molybdate transport system substrate-binding protein